MTKWFFTFTAFVLLGASVAQASTPDVVRGLYYRCRTSERPHDVKGVQPLPGEVERMILDANGNKIEIALYNPGKSDDKVKNVVLHFHSSGQVLEELGERFELAKNKHFALVSFDYPCFTESEGGPSEKTNVEAALSVMQYIHQRFPRAAVSLWGYSLGSAVALQAYSQNLQDEILPVRSMALFGVWDSYQSVCKLRMKDYPSLCSERRLRGHLYRSVDVAAKIRVPTLLVSSKNDRTIPWALTTKFAAEVPHSMLTHIALDYDAHSELQIPFYTNRMVEFFKGAPVRAKQNKL